MALYEAIKHAKRTKRVPPNLRRGNARYRCGICAHYEADGLTPATGKCKLFDYGVRATELCDDYAPSEGARRN